MHNSNRRIETELIRTVQNYSFLDELSSSASKNQHLLVCLPYVSFKKTVGSLTAHEDHNIMGFLTISNNVKKKAGTGSEAFPGELLKLMKKKVNFLQEIMSLLVEYYNNAYDLSFVALSNIHISSSESIPVLPKVNQFSRLRLGAKVFGFTFSVRHFRSANILVQFILDNNNIINIYPDQV